MTRASVESQVQRTISRFMNSFDLKDWETMRRLLAERVRVDYSALRGEPARTITADEFVAARIAALQHLKTHHLIANFDIEVRIDSADVVDPLDHSIDLLERRRPATAFGRSEVDRVNVLSRRRRRATSTTRSTRPNS
jgi:hypothetical protein